jgi:hypothetical protein
MKILLTNENMGEIDKGIDGKCPSALTVPYAWKGRYGFGAA